MHTPCGLRCPPKKVRSPPPRWRLSPPPALRRYRMGGRPGPAQHPRFVGGAGHPDRHGGREPAGQSPPAQSDQGAVDSAATSSGAFERAKQLRARIIGERKAYHAEGPGERARMRSGLKVLRDRLTHTDIAGREQGSLFVTVAAETSGGSHYRWAGARPGPPPETATPPDS